MRKLVYYIAASIDGRIAGPRGEADFFPVGQGEDAAAYMNWVNERYPETVPTQYRSAVGLEGLPNRRFDTVVMGRNTYQLGLDQGVTSPYAHLRQYVVSSAMARIDDPAVTLVRDASALVRQLKDEDGLDIWLCGGGRLAGSLLPEIDQLILKRYPVIAGAGPALVDGDFNPALFTRTDHRSFANGSSITWYDKEASPGAGEIPLAR
ncbi:hypothetical protein JS278_02234 [Acidipropionibacterium virtanenii]|uniref:Bacterial bifunctional deaminase-reductase C-terminal domain-containing protein n=2 Tax=Acidipropionibacterium virtanenii TaxID=2057246 RepID=A0A344UVT8_9ACTN|nr:hypothetical protein JS278_02234 [Acidipropionibacterium virtanenii]